jgi:TolB-like protein/DNA-binding winged helix-turn-helix (wHTH) protein/tetratricopeptide (TPR) repeat protein
LDVADTEQSRTIRFGLFEVDLRAGELRKNGVKIKLQEQPFRVLVTLLQRAGEVVTREELRHELWPTDTFVDFDHSLNAAVKRLRDTLDDSAENPRFIETLPRHGYRFIKERVPYAIPAKPANSPLKHWGPLLVAAVLLVALVLFVLDAGGLRVKTLFRGASQPPIRSLAVLPLTNISGDPEQESLADGMTEELITELSRIASLKVVSRTSVMQYKGEKKKPLPQIGRELNVDAVMEGSVLRAGNRVRIVTHMIYAPGDQSLMAETYEGDLGDIFKMQREVAESITTKVRAKLTPEEESRLHESPKVDPEAYQAFGAATHVDTSGYQGVKKAQSYLEKAIEKDPHFVLPYVFLANTYVLLANRWQSPNEAFPVARKLAHKALELDEKECSAHAVLSEISWRYDWDWQNTEKEILRAVELCPGDSSFHWLHGAHMAVSGRFVEARAEMAKARDLDAIKSEPFAGEAVIGYHSRDYKVLIDIDRAFVHEDSNNWLAHYWLGVGYEGSGQTLQAISEYEKAVALALGDTDPAAALAYAYATSGKKSEARKILSQWLRQSESSYVSPYMIATVYAGLENKDKAFEYLEKAFQERSSDLSYFLRADLRMDRLRSDPRFQDLMRRMNFPK